MVQLAPDVLVFTGNNIVGFKTWHEAVGNLQWTSIPSRGVEKSLLVSSQENQRSGKISQYASTIIQLEKTFSYRINYKSIFLD